MEYLTLGLQILLLGVLIFYYYYRKFHYWSSKGVPGPIPLTPIGNLLDYQLVGQMQLEKDWLEKYGKMYGIYHGTKPVLTIVEVDLIKQVMVKDFHIFVNRFKIVVDHEIWSKNLFNSLDERWRRIRAITSPSFSTGKLKGMHALMNHCVDKLDDFLGEVITQKGGVTNVKEVMTGFTVDVIASTSFATEANIYENFDDKTKNPFLENATNLIAMSPLMVMRTIAQLILPRWLNRAIGNQIALSGQRFDWFINLSKEIVRQRKDNPNVNQNKHGKKRQDLVQLMMDAFIFESELNEKNYEKLTARMDDDHHTAEEEKENGQKSEDKSSGSKKTLSELEIIAQCMLFFIAGFETTATTLSNCLYHLAIHPEEQQRLYNELEQALEGLEPNSDQYLDAISTRIPYLDAFVKETLRMCPPLGRLMRVVGEDGYKINGVSLEKDTQIEASALAVHYCPDYYPDPERFNPDRFMPENKHLLVPYTYLPFGVGPRNCIGMRFAYQEMKLCLAQIVRKFRFEPTKETKIPLKYNNFRLLAVKEIPLRVSKR